MASNQDLACKSWQDAQSFLDLPGELRNRIYELLLVSDDPKTTTFGAGSGIDTAILATCRLIYNEAIHFLHDWNHVFRCTAVRNRHKKACSPVIWHEIPKEALGRLQKITLQIIYETTIRGDCETELLCRASLFYFTETAGLTLQRSVALKELYVELLNNSQRGRGQKRLRSNQVKQTMRRILQPFAYLPSCKLVEICGFDTLDYAAEFEQMRLELGGRDSQIQDLLELILNNG